MRTTLKTLLFFSVLATAMLFALSGCEKSGPKATVEIESPDQIKGIIAEGCWAIELIQSKEAQAKIEYSPFLAGKISAKVGKDGYLRLKLHNVFHVRRRDLIAVIKVPNIELIKASGATVVSVEGDFGGESCEIDLEGASKLQGLNYHGDKVEIEMEGASLCTMTGKVRHAEVNMNGGSVANLIDLQTNTLDVDMDGACKASITVHKSAWGELTGASSLVYRGDGDVSGIKLRGASTLKKI